MPWPGRQVREKRHRLPRECYQGEVSVAFTCCVIDDYSLFTSAEVVSAFVQRLRQAAEKNHCAVLICCYMPEHAHILLQGREPWADT
ncbi:MAG TPA: hypothetical protein VFA26_22310 [Gemmataceae bacterium]|nr:hypothetical protein [Gemmataceae bacterium]